MERLNEELAVVAAFDPTTSTTTTTTDIVDMKHFDRVMFILQTGTCASTTDFTVLSGTTTTAVSTNVTSITQLAASDDNVQAIVEVDASKLGDSHRYIKGQIKTGGSNEFSCIAIGGRARYHPASDGDLSSVAEIVNA